MCESLCVHTPIENHVKMEGNPENSHHSTKFVISLVPPSESMGVLSVSCTSVRPHRYTLHVYLAPSNYLTTLELSALTPSSSYSSASSKKSELSLSERPIIPSWPRLMKLGFPPVRGKTCLTLLANDCPIETESVRQRVASAIYEHKSNRWNESTEKNVRCLLSFWPSRSQIDQLAFSVASLALEMPLAASFWIVCCCEDSCGERLLPPH